MGSHAHIRNTHRACCTSSIRSHTNINHSTTHTHTLTDITHIVLQEAFACSTAPRRKTNLNICWCCAVYIERTHHALIVSCDMAIIRHITRSDGFVIVLAVGTTKPRSRGSSWEMWCICWKVCARSACEWWGSAFAMGSSACFMLCVVLYMRLRQRLSHVYSIWYLMIYIHTYILVYIICTLFSC